MNYLHSTDKSDRPRNPVSLSNIGIVGFFEDILNSGLSLRVKVTGASMAPFLEGGDVVTLKKVPCSELRKGDLILFNSRYGSPVLHRIIRKKRIRDGKMIFETKGDAVKTFDGPVRSDDILGKVCKIEHSEQTARPECINIEAPLERKINYFIAMMNLIESKFYSFYLRTRTALKICG